MEEEYQNNFYNNAKIYGISGDPNGRKCTIYLEQEVMHNGSRHTLTGSIRVGGNVQKKHGREVVMGGQAFAIARDRELGITNRVFWCIDRKLAMPPDIENFRSVRELDEPTKQAVRDLRRRAPKYLRTMDRKILERETRSISDNKGPLVPPIGVIPPLESRVSMAVHKALQIVDSQQYLAQHAVDADVIASEQTQAGETELPSTNAFMVPSTRRTSASDPEAVQATVQPTSMSQGASAEQGASAAQEQGASATQRSGLRRFFGR